MEQLSHKVDWSVEIRRMSEVEEDAYVLAHSVSAIADDTRWQASAVAFYRDDIGELIDAIRTLGEGARALVDDLRRAEREVGS